MPLSDIVNVQISRQTQTVAQAGFGIPMILGTHKRWNDLIRYYSSMQGVAEDFLPSDSEYVAAQAVFSQPITPQQIAIGRRQADTAIIEVITAMTGKSYVTTINDVDFTVIDSSSIAQESNVTFSADFVTGNRINLSLNGNIIGTVTSVIDFDINFVASNSIVATVNGVALSAVLFNTDQATTIAALATHIATATGVASANVTATKEITVVFTSPGNNTVTSVVTTAGASQPVATISEGGFLFDTDQITTMTNLQEALELDPAVAGVAILPDGVDPDRILSITAKANVDAVLDFVTVKLGMSQPVPTIATTTQTTTIETIANLMVRQINAADSANLVASANLITTNSTIVTLNGVALTPVVYSVSNANTLTAIAALIAAQDDIASAVSDGVHTITVTPTSGLDVTVSAATTLGLSQPTWSTAYSNTVQATDNLDGTFTLASSVPAFPYTLAVSTNIVNANAGRVKVEEVTPNTNYNVTLNGTLIQYTTPTMIQTNEEVAAAFVALINANANVAVTATDNFNGSFELSSDDDSLTFVAQVTPGVMTYQFGMVIEPLAATQSVTDSLDAIEGVNDDWYALAMIDRTSANVQLAAAWIEARIKIFGTASSDLNIINQPVGTDTTSIAAILNNAGYIRSFVLYHQDSDSSYPECAWMGNVLPLQPGSETWAFKRLASIAYSDLTTNQSNNALAKECNTYEYVGGVGITQRGTVAQGEYIDIIRGVDWLTSTIQNYVYSVLVNSAKVPYTDAGITSIEAQIKRALNEGITNNFIAADPEPTVTVPKAANVSSADKAARILRNVTFNATLAGAIQAVNITGTVTV